MDSFKLFMHCCGDSKNNSDLEGYIINIIMYYILLSVIKKKCLLTCERSQSKQQAVKPAKVANFQKARFSSQFNRTAE